MNRACPLAAETVRIEPITDAADPRIGAFLSIRERDLARTHGGRFIVEGKVCLETFIRHGRFEPESVLVCQTKLDSLRECLSGLATHIPVYTAGQDVMDRIAGFHVHRGILACGRRGEARQPGDLLPPQGPSTILILSGLSNHDNVGACFRNAAAFGADAVLLDSVCCDPLYRKAIRVSAGNTLRLPFSHQGSGEALAQVAGLAGYETWALTPAATAAPLHDIAVPERIALIVGSEGTGLEQALIARARAVRIPMAKDFDSLNVATAAAIALAHVAHARGQEVRRPGDGRQDGAHAGRTPSFPYPPSGPPSASFRR